MRIHSGALIAVAGALVAAVFAAGIGTGYIFDDLTSVAPLARLRDHPVDLWELVGNDSSGPLGRPLSTLLFAAEQVLFQAGPDFSQGISIALHLLNMLLVIALLASLLTLAEVRHAVPLAIFAGLLWACAPQKTSTVLYIVQRMAMLSALFMLLAMVCYVRGRLAHGRPWLAGSYFSIAALAVVAAPFAKENGVLAIPLLAAVECFAIPRHAGAASGPKRLAGAVLVLGFTGFLVLGVVEYLRADVSYAGRNFSFADRVGSAPAILLDYARQFYAPDIDRLGVLHDDHQVSRPGERPWLFGLSLGVLLLAGAWLLRALLQRRTDPVALGIAVFLIGHSLESGYLPLELYFEHRNYLPSVGLALLAAALLGRLMRFLPARSVGLVAVGAGVYVFSLGLSAVATSAHWRSSEALLRHHLDGHPRSTRAHADSALVLAAGGDYVAAERAIARAYDLSRSEPAARPMGSADPGLLRAAAACLAGVPFPEALPEVVAGPDPIRSAAPRLLAQLHGDGVCSDAGWPALSDWIEAVVGMSLAEGHELRLATLKDLSALERSLADAPRAYLYAAIAAERYPGDPMLILMQLEAALAMGDGVAAAQAQDALRALDASTGLSAVERRLWETLAQRYR